MPYLGQSPKETFSAATSQVITGNGGTSYSLNTAVSSPEDLEVFVNNVQQQPTTTYTVSGSTITFDEALNSTDTCYVVFRGARKESRVHPAGQNLQAANITATGNATVTGDLTVDTNTLFVDASINTVGILNTSPGNYLDGEFTVGNSTKDQYINVVTGAANAAGICFQDTTGTSIVGGLRYTHGDNGLALWAGGSEIARIQSTGLKLTAGKGIDFSNNANASGSDTELLDDYESGTWTASFRSHSNGTETTPANHDTTTQDTAAEYVKIGRLVFVSAWVSVDTKNNHIFFDCTGLPFASAAGSGGVGMALPHLRGIRFGYSSTYIMDKITISAQISRGGHTSCSFSTAATYTPFSGYWHVLNINGGKYVGFAGTYEAA
jgi:hypothetical protein